MNVDIWALPPMIGEITYRTYMIPSSAVILCEPTDKNCKLIYTVIKIHSNDAREFIYENKLTPTIDFPTRIVIPFPDNEDKTIYEIIWSIEKEQLFNDVWNNRVTVTDKPDTMYFVSCDMLEADTQPSMWDKMAKEITDNNVLVHCGDQAYMDGVFNAGITLQTNYGTLKNDDIVMRYGKRYYETWKTHSKILGNVSNYNLWDDHEIKNNITLDDDSLNATEKAVRDCAVRAYEIYQESLHLNKNTIITDYCWYKFFGNTVLLTIERTSRNIGVDEILRAIDHLTSLHGKYNVQRLILCFSSAPIPPPGGIHGDLYRCLTGDKGTYSTSKFWEFKDLQSLYTGLLSWLNFGNNREILVVGGDLHFGVHGIVSNGTNEFSIIVCSPITNQPTPDRWLASKGILHGDTGSGIHQITPSITFKTLSTKARRCFGKVNLKTYPMTISMTYSTIKTPKHKLKYFSKLLEFA